MSDVQCPACDGSGAEPLGRYDCRFCGGDGHLPVPVSVRERIRRALVDGGYCAKEVGSQAVDAALAALTAEVPDDPR